MAVINTLNWATSGWTPLWLSALGGVVYAIARCIYLLYFHPASRFPGPKLAAISYASYCYYWIVGRHPWRQEDLLREYGDVVRIGPNDILFYTPQAVMDIYGKMNKGQEVFVKTNLMDFGQGDLGFSWQPNPAIRKATGRKILPAFSNKANKNKEPLVHAYIDLFVSQMLALGNRAEGLLMNDWLYWLAVDMSADLAYGREMTHLKDGKTSDFATSLRATSFPATLIQLSKKISIIGLLAPLFIPFRVIRAVPAIIAANRAEVQARIDRRGKTKHPDYVDFLIGPDDPPPTTPAEREHLEQVAFQMFAAGFDPINIITYAGLFFLLQNPAVAAHLTAELRGAFARYEDISHDVLVGLPYLQAFIHESLRCHLVAPTGMPRVSPGATVDGTYVAPGLIVESSPFAAMRHPRYFAAPLAFHPERWLPPDHALFDARFADDHLRAFFPFSLGVRQCAGREIAWTQYRLFLAKVLWAFDLVAVRGHEKSFDEQVTAHVMWNHPDLYVRFVPAEGQDVKGQLHPIL